FTCVRKANQTDVGQQFQLQDDPLLNARFAGLRVLWRLLGSRREICVAFATPSSGRQYKRLSVTLDFADHFARLRAPCHRSQGHIQDHVLARSPGPILCFTRFPILGMNMLSVFQVEERPELIVAAQDDTSASSAISTVRPAFGIELLAMKVNKARATLARP